MFPLRHAAVRLLTSRSVSIAARPRTITSFTTAPARQSRTVAPLQFQQRWASNSAEAKKEDVVPISQLQPTPQEEVENAIHEDNASPKVDAAEPDSAEVARSPQNDAVQASQAPEIAETANLTEATDDFTSTGAEPQRVQQQVDDLPRPSGRSAPGIRQPLREAPTPKPTAYVGNLFFDVTENDLNKEFARFGTIKSTRLIRDARGLSKGFGYIEFESTEQAQQAIDEMNQQIFEGRRLMVGFSHSDGIKQGGGQGKDHTPVNAPSKTLFIGNMSFEMTDRDLNQLFRGIRNVIDVRVAIDRRTGQPRGFAHADFVDVKSAMEAMKVLNGKENYGRKLRVDYSFGPSTAPRNTPR